MISLVDYGSTDDEEEEKQVSTTTATTPSVAGPSVTFPSTGAPDKKKKRKKVSKKGKKKKKSTFFLPPEIQAALEGRVDSDSDEGDEESRKRIKLKASADAALAEKNAACGGDLSTILLTKLPAPKFDEGSSSISAPVPVEAPKAVAPKPAVEPPKPVPTPQNMYANVGNGQYSVGGQAGCSGQQQQQYLAQQHGHAQYEAQAAQYSGQQQQYEVEANEQLGSGRGASRRRDRMMERELVSGNFGAVEAHVTDFCPAAMDASSWVKPVETGPKPNPEGVTLKASFWNSSAGEATSSIKPTRQHRSKHQINQLAFDAKSREHELAMMRSSQFQTKRQTQAKYGW